MNCYLLIFKFCRIAELSPGQVFGYFWKVQKAGQLSATPFFILIYKYHNFIELDLRWLTWGLLFTFSFYENAFKTESTSDQHVCHRAACLYGMETEMGLPTS